MLKLLEQCDLRTTRSATPSAASLSPGCSLTSAAGWMPRYEHSEFSTGGHSNENILSSEENFVGNGRMTAPSSDRKRLKSPATDGQSLASERGGDHLDMPCTERSGCEKTEAVSK